MRMVVKILMMMETVMETMMGTGKGEGGDIRTVCTHTVRS
jgi:hypothetical protein